MNHLTDEQLSAHLDTALPERERASADAHLAGCDACRARLADLSALDASLGRALTHDPGDAYFADFADRVAARIAADSPWSPAGAGSAKATRPRSVWAWLTSPRGLSLVGGTAALLVVAGLAWTRFQGRNDGTRSLLDSPRFGIGGRSSTRDQQATPPAIQAPSPEPQPQVLEEQTSPPAATAPSMAAPAAPSAPATGTMRAREVKEQTTQDFSERRLTDSGPARLQQRESTTGAAKLPVAEMKRRALQPAQEKAETRELASGSSQGAAAPAPTPAAAGRRAEPQANAMSQMDATAELDSPCGTVHDTRGQPLVAAQIVALGGVTRTARTGADGRFCLPSLKVGDTLSVLRVGYDPVRIVVGPATSLAIQLQPVGTLGPETGTFAFGKAQESLQSRADSPPRAAFRPGPTPTLAPVADVYANQSSSIRLAVVDAREATARARRERTASSYDRAADRWDRIGVITVGRPSWDARFQGVAALREAHRLEPTGARATRLRARLATFLSLVPETLPERATALRWRAEIESDPR